MTYYWDANLTLGMQDLRLGLQLQPQKNTKLHPCSPSPSPLSTPMIYLYLYVVIGQTGATRTPEVMRTTSISHIFTILVDQ